MEKVNEKNKVILFICYLLLSSNHERRYINREREIHSDIKCVLPSLG